MAVTFTLAYGLVQDAGSGSADIGEPPAGAQMLAVFGTSNGGAVPSPNPPGATGVTYGGLTCASKGLTGVAGTVDLQARLFLLDTFAGKSGTTLAWPANDGNAKNWGALWVLGDGTIVHIETKLGTMGTSSTITHDPGAYAAYGNCGVALNRGFNDPAGTLTGSPNAPSPIGAAIRTNVGSSNYANVRMFELDSQSGGGTYTQTVTQDNASIGSFLFGDVPLPAVRRHQALVIS